MEQRKKENRLREEIMEQKNRLEKEITEQRNKGNRFG
jgi:hypothetical protein